MNKWIGFIFVMLVTLSSSLAAGLSPGDIMGDFSGDKGCIVEIRDYPGNMLEISYIQRGFVQTVEYLAKYRVEMISDDGRFKIEQAYTGPSGEETKVISGKVKNSRLTDIKLERKDSPINKKSFKCKNMVQVGS